MDPLLRALADMPPPKKKRHMVTVDGQSIEVSLEKKLEIMRSGESAFMLKNANINRTSTTKMMFASSDGHPFKSFDTRRAKAKPFLRMKKTTHAKITPNASHSKAPINTS